MVNGIIVNQRRDVEQLYRSGHRFRLCAVVRMKPRAEQCQSRTDALPLGLQCVIEHFRKKRRLFVYHVAQSDPNAL